MGHFEGSFEDSSEVGATEVTISMWSSEHDTEADPGNGLPLPCPCSETTLGSLSYDTSHRQRHSRDPPCTVFVANFEDRQFITRDVAKGIFTGSAISVIFVAILLVLAPNSKTRWLDFTHRISKDAYPHTISALRKFGGKSPFSARHQSVFLSPIRDMNLQDTTDVDRNGKLAHKNNGEKQMRKVKENKINPSHALDRHLAEEFFRRKNSPRVYHKNGTVEVINSLQRNQRKLQSSDGEEGDSGVVYDSSDKNSPSAPTGADPPKDPQLVVAGKMTVEDGACNIAQLNLKTGEWSLQQRIQLSLYNSYSGGEVYSLLANHTIVTNSNQKQFGAGALTMSARMRT